VRKDPGGVRLLDVVVVGGSQAGLAIAWHLAQQGLGFVVLAAGPELGQIWRSRWDSLKLFTRPESWAESRPRFGD
jgi:putative flavoprotein involved in K+ transport